MPVIGWPLEHIENQLRRIFPQEIPFEMGCYIVDLAEVDAADFGHTSGERFKAYHSDRLDLLLRPMLRRKGRWTGRGFATIVDRKPTDDDSRLLDIALHEFAHHCEWPDITYKADPATWPDALKPYEFLSINHCNEVAEQRYTDNPTPQAPWLMHESHWIWCALNVCYRAQRYGILTTLKLMTVAGAPYGLSAGSVYMDSVSEELKRREYDSILDIMRDPVPPALEELFESDEKRFAEYEIYERSMTRAVRADKYFDWTIRHGQRDTTTAV